MNVPFYDEKAHRLEIIWGACSREQCELDLSLYGYEGVQSEEEWFLFSHRQSLCPNQKRHLRRMFRRKLFQGHLQEIRHFEELWDKSCEEWDSYESIKFFTLTQHPEEHLNRR